MGLAMYAHLYMTAAYEFEGGLFRETKVRWDRMKQGFEDLMARYPHPVHLNRYAMAACLAQDKPQTVKLLDDIGAAPLTRQWGGGARGQRLYESCKLWARTK